MRALLVLLVVLPLAGCAQEGDFEPVSFEHDFASGEPRVRTFDLPAGIGRIEAHLEIRGKEDPLRCAATQPARIKLVDPTGREVAQVEAKGGAECTVVNAQRTFDARGGRWTVTFAGEGDLRAIVNVKAAE